MRTALATARLDVAARVLLETATGVGCATLLGQDEEEEEEEERDEEEQEQESEQEHEEACEEQPLEEGQEQARDASPQTVASEDSESNLNLGFAAVFSVVDSALRAVNTVRVSRVVRSLARAQRREHGHEQRQKSLRRAAASDPYRPLDEFLDAAAKHFQGFFDAARQLEKKTVGLCLFRWPLGVMRIVRKIVRFFMTTHADAPASVWMWMHPTPVCVCGAWHQEEWATNALLEALVRRDGETVLDLVAEPLQVETLAGDLEAKEQVGSGGRCTSLPAYLVSTRFFLCCAQSHFLWTATGTCTCAADLLTVAYRHAST